MLWIGLFVASILLGFRLGALIHRTFTDSTVSERVGSAVIAVVYAGALVAVLVA